MIYMNDSLVLKNNLKEERLKRNLSQQELADMVQVVFYLQMLM